jgi:hypothetical protein
MDRKGLSLPVSYKRGLPACSLVGLPACQLNSLKGDCTMKTGKTRLYKTGLLISIGFQLASLPA